MMLDDVSVPAVKRFYNSIYNIYFMVTIYTITNMNFGKLVNVQLIVK